MLRPGSLRVLVAEDDPLVRQALIRLVEQLGHAAMAVPDGAEALQAVSTCPPDLVLSDIRMPGVNGLELCRRLKSNPATHQIPVVLITALGEEQRPLALAAGADGFLIKPFGASELRARIEVPLSGRPAASQSRVAIPGRLASSAPSRATGPLQNHEERKSLETIPLRTTNMEKRLHPRVTLLLAARFDLGREATVRDLSVGGARLEHQGALRPRAACRLRFALDDEVFLFEAGVIWSQAVQPVDGGSDMLFHSGLAFERMPGPAKPLLMELIATQDEQ